MIQNQWYAILPSKSVRYGKIIAVKRLNLPLALFRTQNGKLGCVVDQCTHRGAALSGGKIKGECIQCPFHGLEFSPNGDCKLIPANGKSSTEDLSRYHVKSYPVKEAHGIIYLWYGAEEKVTAEVPFFDDCVDDSYSYSEISDHWNSHYSRCIENQLDVVHLPFIHYNTIGRGNKTLVNGPMTEYINQTIRTSANNEMDHGQLQRPWDQCSISNEIFLNFRFPNIWMNHISEKMKIVIYFAPVDDENTVLFIRFYSKVSKLKWLNDLVAFAGKFGNRVIERQDKRVIITQVPKISSLQSDEKLLAGDRPIVLYRTIREQLKDEGEQI